MKCDTCIFSRRIVSENGFHSICCLSDNEVKECLKSGKHYFKHPAFKNAKEVKNV